MRTKILSFLLFLSLYAITACTEKIVELPPHVETLSCVRVVYAVDGLGDRSYTDGIYKGVCNSLNTLREFAMENYNPESWRHAEGAIADWFNQGSSPKFKNRLLILADGGYVEILKSHPEWQIPDGDAILLLDHRGQLPAPWQDVYTRIVCSYGTAYEAAMLVRHMGAEHSAVISANPELAVLREISDGFIHGFRATGGTLTEDEDVYYLGQGIGDGFAESEKAYQLCYELYGKKGYNFVLPVCGGSIQGILRYTREHPEHFYVCGLDVDMQDHSSCVSFSIVKRMDLLVRDFLEQWLAHIPQERNVTYGIESQYAGLALADRFLADFPTINDVILSFQKESKEAEEAYLNQ